MTIKEIKDRVKFIEKAKRDPEEAHILEDELYSDILMFIAKGSDHNAELAREVLKSTEIKFPRWYA